MSKALLILILIFPSFAFAEPYLAIREGLKCSACHVNRTGGGQRTRYGAGFGAQDVPWKSVDLRGNNIPTYWSAFNDHLAVGGNFRFNNETTVSDRQVETNNFDIHEAELYIHASLLPDQVSFYADESVAPNGVSSREIFGLLEKLPARGYVKTGKFILPYGIRLLDDTAFVRSVTGFSFLNSDYGAEVGFEPGNWTIVGSVTNGTSTPSDNNRSKQVVGTVSYVHDLFRVGVSGSYNKGVQGSSVNSGGVWGGFRLGRASLLGEADLVHNEPDPLQKADELVTHAEIDYPIVHGWNVKVAYEYFDPNRDIAEDQRDRVVVGLEPFLTPFVQLSVFYQFNQSVPNDVVGNTDVLYVQAHIYF